MDLLRKSPLFFLLVVVASSSARAQAPPSIGPFSTTLPIFRITLAGDSIVDEPKVAGRLEVIDDATGSNASDATEVQLSVPIGIEIRGRSSQGFDKKSFGFETWDAEQNDADVALLGLPEESDWVLHGPYSDKTLVRNAFAYTTARTFTEFAPRSRFLELIIDDDYRGVYLLVEKVKRGENRVDVSKLRGEDVSGDELTGGYILENALEFPEEGNGWTGVLSGQVGEFQDGQYSYVYPKGEDIQPEQAAYIKDFMDAFEGSLIERSFVDPEEGYAAYVDLGSWTDYVVFQELTRDVDAYLGSTFLWKEKDSKGGKLHAGPVWDFNLGFGNDDYCGGTGTYGFAIQRNEVCNPKLRPLIWTRVWEDPAFKDRVAERWQGLRQGPLSDEAILARYDSLITLIDASGARERNFARWQFVTGNYRWPNPFVGATYEEDVAYMRDWLVGRTTWLDGALGATVPTATAELVADLPLHPNPVAAGQSITVDLPKGGAPGTSIRIHGTAGQVVGSYPVPANDPRLTLSIRTPGLYLVELRSADGARVSTRRIVVY